MSQIQNVDSQLLCRMQKWRSPPPFFATLSNQSHGESCRTTGTATRLLEETSSERVSEFLIMIFELYRFLIIIVNKFIKIRYTESHENLWHKLRLASPTRGETDQNNHHQGQTPQHWWLLPVLASNSGKWQSVSHCGKRNEREWGRQKFR
jgi:hypothetical protein